MDITLHPGQLDVFEAEHRYKVVAAGRRFGKSFLAAVTLFVEASKNTKIRSDGVEVDLLLEKVYYVAPTFTQGKEILWPVLKELGYDLIAQAYENEAKVRLVNGREICIKGADRPDSLRGTGLSYVVMDEYAFMKEEVWEMIIRPQLARAEGGALFIGTPDGKNHFFQLYQNAKTDDEGLWGSWHFKTMDNPHLPSAEIGQMKASMTTERFRQEAEASFESGAGVLLLREMFPIVEDVPVGYDYIAIDLAGFVPIEGGRKIRRLDEHAISVVRNHEGGWCVRDVIHGRWDTRETALRIVKAYRDYRPMGLGIERGMAMNAVLPYLQDEMKRLSTFFTVTPLTHGNQKKTDRIAWALQGRAEKGRIQLLKGKWNEPWLEQACDFPSTTAKDDLIDSTAYTDQLAVPYYAGDDFLAEDWEPMDITAGY